MNPEKRWSLVFHPSSRFKHMFWFLASLPAFVFLLDLTLLISAYLNPYIFGIILIYIVLLPALSAFKNSKTYFAVLPIPVLGCWAMSLFYLSSFAVPVLPAIVVVSAVPVTLVPLVHLATRMRNMVLGKPMSSFSRLSSGLSSGVFFLASPFVLGHARIEDYPMYLIALYPMFIVAYVLSSIHFVNSMYRYRVLCQRLSILRIERKMQEIWRILEDEFRNQQKDVDLLRYYFTSAIRSFEEGAYDESFISGYQTIREETIVDPKKHISDKRDEEPESFSEIRTILMHSRRKEAEIDVKKIRETKKELPNYCLELLQRDFKFLETLTLDSNRADKSVISSGVEEGANGRLSHPKGN